MREDISFFHSERAVWKLQKFFLTQKKFRQINYLVISLVKPLLSRNFCEKSVRENFCNFHSCAHPYYNCTKISVGCSLSTFFPYHQCFSNFLCRPHIVIICSGRDVLKKFHEIPYTNQKISLIKTFFCK